MKIQQYKVRFFAYAVLAGLRTIDELPELYKEAVREYLEEQTKKMEEEIKEEARKQGLKF